MHNHLKFIPQFVITQLEKLEKITFSKTRKIKMALYTHRRVVYNFFQICKKIIYPYAQPLKLSAKFSEKNNTFSEGVYVRRTNSNWSFIHIWVSFEFFSKYKNIYFSYLIISEIFSWFGEPFCLLLLILLLLPLKLE